jgi:hypothetical protein
MGSDPTMSSRASDEPTGSGFDIRDPWGEAVCSFLSDLLDNVDVQLLSGEADEPSDVEDPAMSPVRQVGPDGRVRRFILRSRTATGHTTSWAEELSSEMRDLPGSAMRALARLTASSALWDPSFPSLRRALREVVIAEVVADRLELRSSARVGVDAIVATVAETLDYMEELAAGRLEGAPITHGVVITVEDAGTVEHHDVIPYPGDLRSLKRTPLLFDGTHATLLVSLVGGALGGVSRDSLPDPPPGVAAIGSFDEFPGLDGALTAAASAVYGGIGIYLRADRSIWVFDRGQPLFIRRTTTWKSVAFESFIGLLEFHGQTTPAIAQRLAHAALRLSMQGHGAVLAIASGRAALDGRLEERDRYASMAPGEARVSEDALHRLLPAREMTTPSSLARLARLDGATVIDRAGSVLAFGAIVRIGESRGEGARTAAARSLSQAVDLAMSVSQDGPISVFRHGDPLLEIL